MQHTDSFRAMDTAIDVIVETESHVPPLAAFAGVRLLFEQQEARFSRFRATSLLSRLNRGEPVSDAWLVAACGLSLEAHTFTGGRFNPLVLPALEAAGYDRTFAEVRPSSSPSAPSIAVPDPREVLVIDGERVSLRAGALDLGGIVKGWTVDLAAGHLAREFSGALVNAGGDLRAIGTEPGVDGWWCEIEAPGGDVAWAGAVRAGLATSTTLRRRWAGPGGVMRHHLIDPATGLPSASPFVQASAWAAETWRAECWAKAVVIGGEPALRDAEAAGVPVLAFTGAGEAAGSAP